MRTWILAVIGALSRVVGDRAVSGSALSRVVAIFVVIGCGAPQPRAVPSNVERASDAGSPPDAACANQCIDTCCRADQVCSHGRAGDGTYAKCLTR